MDDASTRQAPGESAAAGGYDRGRVLALRSDPIAPEEKGFGGPRHRLPTTAEELSGTDSAGGWLEQSPACAQLRGRTAQHRDDGCLQPAARHHRPSAREDDDGAAAGGTADRRWSPRNHRRNRLSGATVSRLRCRTDPDRQPGGGPRVARLARHRSRRRPRAFRQLLRRQPHGGRAPAGCHVAARLGHPECPRRAGARRRAYGCADHRGGPRRGRCRRAICPAAPGRRRRLRRVHRHGQRRRGVPGRRRLLRAAGVGRDAAESTPLCSTRYPSSQQAGRRTSTRSWRSWPGAPPGGSSCAPAAT